MNMHNKYMKVNINWIESQNGSETLTQHDKNRLNDPVQFSSIILSKYIHNKSIYIYILNKYSNNMQYSSSNSQLVNPEMNVVTFDCVHGLIHSL